MHAVAVTAFVIDAIQKTLSAVDRRPERALVDDAIVSRADRDDARNTAGIHRLAEHLVDLSERGAQRRSGASSPHD